jgi:choline dehydrogenase-like flavoprotein
VTEHDVVIVGAGVTGAIIARRLAERGHDVLVLEAGPSTGATWGDYQANVEQYHAASIKVPNSPYAGGPFAPSPSVADITTIPPGGVDATGYFVQRGPLPFGSDYLRSAGGTTLHWLGTCLRMLPHDFETRTRYGHGTDWPITYDELAPDYRRAERELGVAADVEDQRYLGVSFPDDYVYPMYRIPPSWCDRRIAAGLEGHRIHLDGTAYELAVTSTPQARNGMPNPAYDRGRGYRPVGAVDDPHRGQRCEGNSSCIPICPVQAKYNARKTLAAAGRRHVTVRTQAVATRVQVGTRGRITGVTYRTYDGNGPGPAQTVTAQVYVLAANAIENAKLLLASGAGDRSGQVGRNLMDHPFLMTWALMPDNVGAFRGPSSTSGIENLRDGGFRRQRSAFRVELANWGWDFCAFGPYSDVEAAVHADGLFGAALRRRLATTVPHQIRFGFLLEQPPRRRNRVTIDRRWTDAMGNPRPVLRYDLDDHVRRGFAAAAALSRQAFAALGAVEATTWRPTSPGYVTYDGAGYVFDGSGHLGGTHRMGPNGDVAVVDTYQRSHDHDNLYVVGCGSMVTLGTSNPTLTAAALAARSARSIVADLGSRSPEPG